ncbi:MAG: hypothetical protein ACK4YP_03305 [Myxococcota bacterium]
MPPRKKAAGGQAPPAPAATEQWQAVEDQLLVTWRTNWGDRLGDPFAAAVKHLPGYVSSAIREEIYWVSIGIAGQTREYGVPISPNAPENTRYYVLEGGRGPIADLTMLHFAGADGGVSRRGTATVRIEAASEVVPASGTPPGPPPVAVPAPSTRLPPTEAFVSADAGPSQPTPAPDGPALGAPTEPPSQRRPPARPTPGPRQTGAPSATILPASPRQQRVAPPDTEPPAAPEFSLATVGWTLAGLAALYGSGSLAAGHTDGLGDDAAIARDAVWFLIVVGALSTLQLARAARAAARATYTIPWSVERFAAGGGSLPDCANFANGSGAEAVGALEARVSGAANVQILLGMVLTAGYLALEAPVFVEASEALRSGDSANMAVIVSALLGLGPKAFLATAIAVFSSLILSFVGQRHISALRARLPDNRTVLERWHHGRALHQEEIEAATRSRDAAMLDVALSNQSVKELNLALHQAAATFSGLQATVDAFKEAAGQIVAAQVTLDRLMQAFQASDARAKDLAEGLSSLAGEVRTYSDTMLTNSKEFGNALHRLASEQGARLVSDSVDQTLRALTPEFARLAQDLHDNMGRSADALRNRAVDEFSNSVGQTRDDLARLDASIVGFSGHLQGLVRDLARWGGEVETSGANLRAALASLTEGLDPTGRMLPGVQSVERAREELERSSAQLAHASGQLAAGMDAVRRNAEMIGQLREAMRGGLPRGQA